MLLINAMSFDIMTTYDHHVTMTSSNERTVRVAELKARLSEFLRAARGGHTITVFDRDTPVARLVPFHTEGDSMTVRKPLRSLGEVILPPPLDRPIDSLAALLEERQNER